MDIDTTDAILIFDEAHNMEDVARWASPWFSQLSPRYSDPSCLCALALNQVSFTLYERREVCILPFLPLTLVSA